MVKDDLWSDPPDELGDAEISIELVKHQTDISADSTAIDSSKPVLKKTVLIKIAEPNASTSYLFRQLGQNHFYATRENAVFESNYQKSVLPSPNTTSTEKNAKDNNQLDISSSSRPLVPRDLPVTPVPAPIIFEDLWSSNSEPLTIMEEPTTSEQRTLAPTAEIAEMDSGLELEDDLWVDSDGNLQTSDEDEELLGNWSSSEQVFIQEANDAKALLADPLLSDFESTPHPFAEFENESTLRGFERAVESVFLLDSLEFIDIEAELAELERIEAESAAQKLEVEHAVGIVTKSERGQAPGWMGSSSVLYINWEDKEKAEQDALERLGYTNLKLSEATRTFVIQAARASKLTLRQEQLLTTRLGNARSRLAQLPCQDDYEEQRNEIKAEITELERTLAYNLQWVAVKKAPHFLGQGIELDDLIQYGMLGVIAGIRHFDISRGARLLPAVNWWVFQALTRAVIEYKPLIRLPVHIHESLENIKKHRAELEKVLGRPPIHEELASAVQTPIKRLKELLSLPQTISLDPYIRAEYINDGYSFQSVEQDFSVSEDIINDEINELDIEQDVDAMLQCLTERERLVIELRYGFDDDGRDDRTLEEIGKVLHVTRERVRQIEERAIKKMKGTLLF